MAATQSTHANRAAPPGVLVLGATGGFDGTLARMLIAEGREVTVTARAPARAEAGNGRHIPRVPALIAVGKPAAGSCAPGARPGLDDLTPAGAETARARVRTRSLHEEETA